MQEYHDEVPYPLLTHGPVEYDSMRERIVPMISESLKATQLLDINLVGWDLVMVPMANAMLAGIAIAIRGYDLVGPGKELMQFRPFSTWNPTRDEVDQLVAALISGLREAREQQNKR